MERIRRSAVAGGFYEADPEDLKKQIEWCFTHPIGPGEIPKKAIETQPRKLIGIISPHAGYMYSGPVAAHGYSKVALDGKPELIIIVGPNHTGYGPSISVMSEGVWETPLGKVHIDSDTAKKIISGCKYAKADHLAHIYEHSIEVQLPFLQYIFGSDFVFVPIVMMIQELETSTCLGESIAKAVEDKNVLLIASSDLTHYESHERAVKKDSLLIKAILNMNIKEIFETIYMHNISACGPGAIATIIHASKILGAKKIALLKYATSGDVSGDKTHVVGYSSFSIEK